MKKNRTRRIMCLLACLMLLVPQMALGDYATLKSGDRSQEVLRMQHALATLGYTLKEDGIFGKGTDAVVRAFQSAQGLKVDGKAGNQTLQRMYELAGGDVPEDAQPTPVKSAQPTPTPTVALTPPPGAELATVSGGSLKLRGARSTSAAWKTIIPAGASVAVTQKGSTWCAVTYGGYSGHVMTKYLSFDPAATNTPAPQDMQTPPPTPSGSATETPPPPTPAPLPAGAEYATVTGGSLSLRSAASKTSVRIISIPDKATVIVTQKKGKWCAVTYNSRKGYVMTEYLVFAAANVTATPAPTPSVTVGEPLSGVTARVIGGVLPMFSQPDMEKGFMTYIPDNMVISVLEKGGKWSKVTFRSKTGYALTEFLDFSNPAATVSPADDETVYNSVYIPLETNCTAVVTGGNLTFYALDGNGTVIGSIPDKTRVHVFKIGDFNSCVTYQGKNGYVRTAGLTFVEGGDAPQSAPVSSSTGKTIVRESQSFTIMEGSSCALDQTPGAQVRDFFGGDDSVAMPAQYIGHAYITGYKPGKTQFTMVEYNSDTETTYLTTAYVTVIKRNYTTTFLLDYSQNTSYEKGWVQTNGYLFPVGMVHHVKIKITGPEAAITFRSTNPKVATVSADGTITAKAEGSTIIVVACGEQSIPLDVTVYSATTGGGMNATVNTERQVPLKLYKSPDENSTVLTTIAFNRNIRLLQKGTVWCKTYQNGYTGYVKSDKLKFFCNSVIDASPIITPPPLK